MKEEQEKTAASTVSVNQAVNAPSETSTQLVKEKKK